MPTIAILVRIFITLADETQRVAAVSFVRTQNGHLLVPLAHYENSPMF